MIEVDKCRLEPDKDRRVAQILATNVTREQLAEVVWSMERIHATQYDLIMELMNRNAKLRELIRTVWLAGDFRAFLGVEEIKERMRELGIEVDS